MKLQHNLSDLVVTESGLQKKDNPNTTIIGLKFRSSYFTPNVIPYHLSTVKFLIKK